jgi:GT2 family glycosyltransferase
MIDRDEKRDRGKPSGRPDLSVVVASYNTRDLLRECLTTLRGATKGVTTEVIVVDNSSGDGTRTMVEQEFPEVRLLANPKNEGFARANNRALKDARGRFVLLLNPDTLVPPDTIDPLVEFLNANPKVGMVGCRVDRPDGRLDEACKRNFPTPWSALARLLALDRLLGIGRGYRRSEEDPAGRYEVDAVVGAFMLLRRETIEDVGGLDEDYFMFGEDLDWCYRVKQRDWQIYYVGDRSIVHHKGASTRQEPQKMNYHFHRAMFLFHRKHLVDRYPFFVNWLVYVGITLRYAARSAWNLLWRGRAEARLRPTEVARLKMRYGLELDPPGGPAAAGGEAAS